MTRKTSTGTNNDASIYSFGPLSDPEGEDKDNAEVVEEVNAEIVALVPSNVDKNKKKNKRKTKTKRKRITTKNKL